MSCPGIDEQNLAESLRFAMLGALGDESWTDAFAPPQLQAIRARFPQLWYLGLWRRTLVYRTVWPFLSRESWEDNISTEFNQNCWLYLVVGLFSIPSEFSEFFVLPSAGADALGAAEANMPRCLQDGEWHGQTCRSSRGQWPKWERAVAGGGAGFGFGAGLCEFVIFVWCPGECPVKGWTSASSSAVEASGRRDCSTQSLPWTVTRDRFTLGRAARAESFSERGRAQRAWNAQLVQPFVDSWNSLSMHCPLASISLVALYGESMQEGATSKVRMDWCAPCPSCKSWMN